MANDTHTVTITLVRNKADDEKAAAERFPGVEIDVAIQHLLNNEVNQCIKAGRLSGSLASVVRSTTS